MENFFILVKALVGLIITLMILGLVAGMYPNIIQ